MAAIEKIGGSAVVTISRWQGGERQVSSGTHGANRYRMLVGNLGGDATPELVLFPISGHRDERPPPTRVVRWTGDEYEVMYFNVVGRLGTLADFDGDEVAELVLVVPPRPDALETDPAELRTYALTGGVLRQTRRRRLEDGVAALAAADLDGDGRDELVRVTASRTTSRGRLNVYGASATELLPLFSSEPEWLLNVEFFAVFESGGTHYIYAERGALRWRMVLRLSPADDGSFTLTGVRGIKGRARLLEDALKTTAAYSTERQTHFRMVGADRLEAW